MKELENSGVMLAASVPESKWGELLRVSSSRATCGRRSHYLRVGNAVLYQRELRSLEESPDPARWSDQAEGDIHSCSKYSCWPMFLE
jgi:hypothetical protein